MQDNSRVRWIDRFVHDREDLKTYLCAADVYTLPSRHEGFAIAPLEAMACGLPVVAADTSGVADLVPDGEASGGVVVPREDATALASALGRLLDDPARAGSSGREQDGGSRRSSRSRSSDGGSVTSSCRSGRWKRAEPRLRCFVVSDSRPYGERHRARAAPRPR